LLESMIPRRMVRADTLALETGVKGLGEVEAEPGHEKKAPSVKKYRLSPFLVGWYESFLQDAHTLMWLPFGCCTRGRLPDCLRFQRLIHKWI